VLPPLLALSVEAVEDFLRALTLPFCPPEGPAAAAASGASATPPPAEEETGESAANPTDRRRSL